MEELLDGCINGTFDSWSVAWDDGSNDGCVVSLFDGRNNMISDSSTLGILDSSEDCWNLR